MPKNKDLASTSVPGAAIVVGGLLLLACLVAPLYAAQRVVWKVCTHSMHKPGSARSSHVGVH